VSAQWDSPASLSTPVPHRRENTSHRRTRRTPRTETAAAKIEALREFYGPLRLMRLPRRNAR
jgi:hypothetical protein